MRRWSQKVDYVLFVPDSSCQGVMTLDYDVVLCKDVSPYSPLKSGFRSQLFSKRQGRRKNTVVGPNIDPIFRNQSHRREVGFVCTKNTRGIFHVVNPSFSVSFLQGKRVSNIWFGFHKRIVTSPLSTPNLYSFLKNFRFPTFKTGFPCNPQ